MATARLKPHELSKQTLSRDTDPAAEAVQLEIYGRMPALRKLELVVDVLELGRELAIAGLRSRHPRAGAAELRRRFYGLWPGEELATRAYGLLEDWL